MMMNYIMKLLFLGFLQYHNKVSCFMLQQIEEPCPIGAHAVLIVPPTWVVRIRRNQVALLIHGPYLCIIIVLSMFCSLGLFGERKTVFLCFTAVLYEVQ